MNIVLIGIQGCGKGTLVSGLEKHYDISLISMGQLLRDEISTGSNLGKTIKETIDVLNNKHLCFINSKCSFWSNNTFLFNAKNIASDSLHNEFKSL